MSREIGSVNCLKCEEVSMAWFQDFFPFFSFFFFNSILEDLQTWNLVGKPMSLSIKQYVYLNISPLLTTKVLKAEDFLKLLFEMHSFANT